MGVPESVFLTQVDAFVGAALGHPDPLFLRVLATVAHTQDTSFALPAAM
jgi:hypothetical protein